VIKYDANDTWEDSTADSGVNVGEGLLLHIAVPSLANLIAEVAILRIEGQNGSSLNPISGSAHRFGEDAYGATASIPNNHSGRASCVSASVRVTPWFIVRR